MDLEELFSQGSSHHFCPYYFSKTLVDTAHIVFLPYNYLTHDEFSWMMKDQFQNSILLIDEAHNIG